MLLYLYIWNARGRSIYSVAELNLQNIDLQAAVWILTDMDLVEQERKMYAYLKIIRGLAEAGNC